MKGLGGIYLRGSTYWIAYNYRGVRYRESAHSDSEAVARKLLKKRLGEIGRGKVIGPIEDRLSFDDLADALVADYTANGKRSIRSIRLSIRHLRTFFGNAKAVDISSDRVMAYAAERQKDGAANASINRELAALRRAFSLMTKAGRISNAPHVSMLAENNTREGFLEPGDFARLHSHLPGYLRDPVLFLYRSGWRVGEMRSLEWRDVYDSEIRLRPANSKSKKGRVLPLTGELKAIIDRARNGRRPNCPFVWHLADAPIGDFRKTWNAARRAARLAHILVHDLRRSAVRNMIRSGVSQPVAMAISGHRTASIFARYDVTSTDDIARALERTERYIEQAPAAKIAVLTQISHNDSPFESSISNEVPDFVEEFGATRRIRTGDLLITKPF
jgi:integrase